VLRRSGRLSRRRGECRPTPRSLEAKLLEHDATAADAFAELIGFAITNRTLVLAMARERTITGHHRHGDSELYEYDRVKLRMETLEELADGVNYRLRDRQLREVPGYLATTDQHGTKCRYSYERGGWWHCECEARTAG
jgi:hypothetical protein